MSLKIKKSLTIDATLYSATYVSLIKSNKHKYKMTQTDQFDLVYKLMLIGTIQVFFIGGIFFFNGLSFKLYNSTPLQITLFFTTLLLHLGNLGAFRSGLYMMKYSLCHPEEFTHPNLAFFIGFMYMQILLVSEWVNIMKGTEKKKPQDLITGYIGFKVITELPKIYLGSIIDLPIKAAVGKLTATKGRKDPLNEGKVNWFLTLIYCSSKWFYHSFYFYFMPFMVIYLPLVVLLFDKE